MEMMDTIFCFLQNTLWQDLIPNTAKGKQKVHQKLLTKGTTWHERCGVVHHRHLGRRQHT